MSKKIAVLGIGNVLIGDDAFGPYVVSSFAAAFDVHPDVHVLDVGPGESTRVDLRDRAIVTIDAMGCQRDIAQKIIDKKAGPNGRLLAINFNTRSQVAWRSVRRHVRDGAVGLVRHLAAGDLVLHGATVVRTASGFAPTPPQAMPSSG